MNARIRELYKQAHLVREYPADDPMRGGNLATVYWGGEVSATKFAELIVKECIFMADEFELDVNRVGLVDRIKEHFGVRE
jgi:hypothetical protein